MELGKKKRIAPWIPTPIEIIVEALKYANVGEGDAVYDLGAGDGRVVILAAKLFGARGVAIEVDEKMCVVIEANAKEYGVLNKIKVLCDDFFNVDLSDATVVYMYLYRSINEVLASKLSRELNDYTRVITIDFPIPNWIPIGIKRLPDRGGMIRTIYLYVAGVSDPNRRVKRIKSNIGIDAS